ncbi:hypothetical protein [Massilia sp. DWR3-1-1]|uniref:hypothetical protein n=1 Tax=Massilia sp. DWR3-1-1 TaxID=2804559 RepID=UPI003CF6319D
MNYIVSVRDTGCFSSNGQRWHEEALNLWSGQLQYQLDGGVLKDARSKIGGRNLFNKLPPTAQSGYNGGLYNLYGRYLYLNLSKTV